MRNLVWIEKAQMQDNIVKGTRSRGKFSALNHPSHLES